MSTTVVVPWREGDPHRERALAWVVPRYRELGWEVVVSEAPPGPWIKALAVMPAVESADVGTTIVMSDADVWCDQIELAVGAVEAGEPWSAPHTTVHRLSEDGTTSFIAGGSADDYDQPPYTGQCGGGILVAPRETLLDIPLDPRFVGWGQEDASHFFALHVLAGPCRRFNGTLIHLFHPHPPRMDRKRGSHESWALFRRYLQARYTSGAMAALVEEARESRHPDKSALHSLHRVG